MHRLMYFIAVSCGAVHRRAALQRSAFGVKGPISLRRVFTSLQTEVIRSCSIGNVEIQNRNAHLHMFGENNTVHKNTAQVEGRRSRRLDLKAGCTVGRPARGVAPIRQLAIDA